jgi:ornithine--oxo-acid transaminase
MVLDISSLYAQREAERYALHARHLNGQLVRVLQAIGYDVGFCRGEGPYLFDRSGARYLDLLGGWGVFALGRNHPGVRDALKAVLESDLPNLVQMDVSPLAGVLAERLLQRAPHLDKVFFANSGAETVEAAIKFARQATGRTAIVHCSNAFHGLTYGALSLTPDENFRKGFGPLLPDCIEVPFDDLDRLEEALRARPVAAFIVEPIQGKGVNVPSDDYMSGAAAICRKHGTLFVADEIQCGLGRTGRFFAFEHWQALPDMVLMAKSLSGGHVPVGAVLARKWIFDRVFDRMDRAVVHGSTFAKNDLAMAAGLATLDAIDDERLLACASSRGERLLSAFNDMARRHEFVRSVRGKGLMIGIEFGAPRSLKLRATWSMVESASRGLFCQLIAIPLFRDHKILIQVAGHASHTIKLLPPLTISDADCEWIERAFEAVFADCHRASAVWSLAKSLAEHALAMRNRPGTDKRSSRSPEPFGAAPDP